MRQLLFTIRLSLLSFAPQTYISNYLQKLIRFKLDFFRISRRYYPCAYTHAVCGAWCEKDMEIVLIF